MLRAAIVALLLLLSNTRPKRALGADEPPMGFVKRSGSTLTVGGKPFSLVGVNRYDLAGGPQAQVCRHWGTLAQWSTWSQAIIDDAKSMNVNVIRIWAFQNFAGPSGTDFSYLARVIAYAKTRRIRVIPVLANNWSDCERGNIKDVAFYSCGYKKPYGYKLSFPDYLKAIVAHFQNEPAIAAWEILNEGKSVEKPEALASFIRDMARLIKSIDKKHLVVGGGALQDWQGLKGVQDFESYNCDDAVDIVDHHQYGDDNVAWPTATAAAFQVAKSFKKPFLIGEAGIQAHNRTPFVRGAQFDAKIIEGAKRGIAGFLIWHLARQGQYDGDGFSFHVNEPTGVVLRNARKKWTK